MEGETTMAISELMTNATNIVTPVLAWVTQVVTTITSNPLLLLFAILGLVGLGVGLVRRILAIN